MSSTGDNVDVFTKPEADVIVRSSDEIEFRVHKSVLSTASCIFADTFGVPQPESFKVIDDELDDAGGKDDLPIVALTEDAETLRVILRTLYADGISTIEDLGLLARVLAAAEKYEMAGIISTLAPFLHTPRFLESEPFRVFAIAYHFTLPETILIAAKATLLHPFPSSLPPELEYLPTPDVYHKLLLYRTRCEATLEPTLVDWMSVWIGFDESRFRHSIRAGAMDMPAWSTVDRGGCSFCVRGTYTTLNKYGVLPLWFIDHLERTRDMFKDRIEGPTVKSLKLLEKTISILPSIGSNGGCDCAEEAPLQLMQFSERLSDKLDEKLAEVSVQPTITHFGVISLADIV
ncbi:hypothetical protein PHLCEN_2v7485 [Hermanssonia centrifuga]|uniref:BTB domain-containing protein n=1 Tax=Hermanssonia centrifuga TaxID=98765 RepID=A0A2R6NWG1_9APHY|nr:hypothetical protein PHLCEN_2v7485 [Hermanssonia centrifuga]